MFYNLRFRNGAIWLCCLMVAFSTYAETDLLADLRSSLLSKKSVSGYFLQCVVQDGVVVQATGQYLLIPEERLELMFESPKRNSLTYFSDGTVVTGNFSGEAKPRYSSLGNLIFSMINFDVLVLERHFNIESSGTMGGFLITLSPKKRIKKLVQSVFIAGVGDLINKIELIGSDSREVKLKFGAASYLGASGCG